MKYVIEKDLEKKRLVNYNVNIEGLDVKPINEVPSLDIKANKVTFVDRELTESFIKKRVNRKIDKIISFMLRILNDEGTTEDDSGMVLDEINRLKGIILNKYRKHMLDSEYKEVLTKVILIEEEFKRSYNQKMFTNYLDSYYEEELISGRGR